MTDAVCVSPVFVSTSGASQQLTHLGVKVSSPAWTGSGNELIIVLEGSTLAPAGQDGGTPRTLVEGEGATFSPPRQRHHDAAA